MLLQRAPTFCDGTPCSKSHEAATSGKLLKKKGNNGGDDGARTRLASRQVSASQGNCLKLRRAVKPIWQLEAGVFIGMFARR